MLGKNDDDVLSLLYTPNRRLYGVSLEKIPFSPQQRKKPAKSTAACLDFTDSCKSGGNFDCTNLFLL